MHAIMMARGFFSRRIVFVLAAIILGGMMERSSASRADAISDSQETDRLFRDMAVLNIPRILPPVDIELPDLNDRKLRLSDLKGKIVFLNFWATWCPSCKIEMPSMEKLHARLKGKNFAMVAVDLQEPASRVKAFVKRYKLSFTILLDSKGEVGSLFGVRSIPTTYILDTDGGIIGMVLGPREWDGKESIALFEHLINRKADRLSLSQTPKNNTP